MEAVLDDRRSRTRSSQSQDAALARLLARDFAGTLLRFVDSAAPHRRGRRQSVAWDFWAQFEQFERLEELRQFRPALFQALPEAPPGTGLGARDSGLGMRVRAPALAARPNSEIATTRAASPEPRAPDLAAMIINQWVPAAHRGDAIGDSARRVREMLRRQGHTVRHLRADDRR